jgi:hypothetical protein
MNPPFTEKKGVAALVGRRTFFVSLVSLVRRTSRAGISDVRISGQLMTCSYNLSSSLLQVQRSAIDWRSECIMYNLRIEMEN